MALINEQVGGRKMVKRENSWVQVVKASCLFFLTLIISLVVVKFGSIGSHSPMRGHVGHPEASQGDLENQPIL